MSRLNSHSPRQSIFRALLPMLSATLVLTGCTSFSVPTESFSNDQDSQEKTPEVESETGEASSDSETGQADNRVSIREPL